MAADLGEAQGADIAQAVDRLMRHARGFAITVDGDALTEIYCEGCKGMPRRALRDGVDKVLRKWSDTFRLPPPGAIWDAMKQEIAEWGKDLAELKAMCPIIEPEPEPEPEPAKDGKSIDEILAGVRSHLAANTEAFHIKATGRGSHG